MKKSLFYSVLLLAIGTLVGWAASKSLLPLPWMLGPLLACAIWSINFGEKIAPPNYVFPQKFRNYFVAIIGVMIGSQVTPDLMDQYTKYFPSIFGLLILASALITLSAEKNTNYNFYPNFFFKSN